MARQRFALFGRVFLILVVLSWFAFNSLPGTCLLGTAGGILGALAWYSAQYGLGSSGMSSWGFVAGAVIVAVLYSRLHDRRWQVGNLPDAVAPAILLGAALVRIGCLIHGHRYGKPSLPRRATRSCS